MYSITEIAEYKYLSDEVACAPPEETLLALATDNARVLERLRSTHELCARYGEIGTTSLVEVGSIRQSATCGFLNATLDLRQDCRQTNAATQHFGTK